MPILWYRSRLIYSGRSVPLTVTPTGTLVQEKNFLSTNESNYSLCFTPIRASICLYY